MNEVPNLRDAQATAQRKTALSNKLTALSKLLSQPGEERVRPSAVNHGSASSSPHVARTRRRPRSSTFWSGFHLRDTNETGPVFCPVGETGPDDGDCTACEVGKYKDAEGSAECADCPGTVSTQSLASIRSDGLTNDS